MADLDCDACYVTLGLVYRVRNGVGSRIAQRAWVAGFRLDWL